MSFNIDVFKRDAESCGKDAEFFIESSSAKEFNSGEILRAALKYQGQGFSVIPIGREKKPLVEWKRYQTERATHEQVRAWFEQFPDANIGAVTGAVSGIVVIDIEKDGDARGYPPTVTSQTGGGGFPLFF